MLQFSDVRASVAPIEDLIQTMPAMLLGEGADLLSSGSRRSVVAAFIRRSYHFSSLNGAREGSFRTGDCCWKADQSQNRCWDINGQFYGGAFALSFATAQTEKQWKDTDAVAFAVEDIIAPREKIAVVLDAPALISEPYQRAQELFSGLGVPVLQFGQISQWASRAVIDVPEQAAH